MNTQLRILIADSSVAMRSGLKALLCSMNADFVEASDGLEGLKLVSESHFDVVITSIDMPNMDGLELCRRIKDESGTQQLPVIVVSSFDTDTDIDKAIQAGASAYIEKREAQSRLYDTVQKVLMSTSSSELARTILVVEDSRPIRIMIQKGLMEAGFRVITAGNGKEALLALTKEHPDLILSDINMPEMDGFELCEVLHSDPELASIPFVVMSTMNDRDHMRQIIKYGATDYMVKPFSIDEMVIHIERFLADRLLLLLKDKERLDTEREMMLGGIKSLLTILEIRDSGLRDHAEAVARVAAGMATVAGANKREIEVVELGAKLHDIGKIGLKDDILFKVDPLTDQEWRFFKQHPRMGANIVQALPHLPEEIISIVLFHHERPDGKGYPKGLRAEQIPKWAGITAVANTYHRLTGKRPYGQELPQERALQTIEDMSGTELNTDYVYLLFDWIRLGSELK